MNTIDPIPPSKQGARPITGLHMLDKALSIAPIPIVKSRDGVPMANSRDIADFFGRKHRNILRDIRNLIKLEPSLAILKFDEITYRDLQNGEEYPAYEMTRDGFSLLAMSFKGPKALKWKLSYIDAFASLEEALRRQAPSPIDISTLLDDPRLLRKLLAGYSEQNIELKKTIESMKPAVIALERIANAEGTLTISEAAKVLGVSQTKLFKYLDSSDWIFRHSSRSPWLARKPKLDSGLLTQKATPLKKVDGENRFTLLTSDEKPDKIGTQVRITTKGMALLAKLLATPAPVSTLELFKDDGEPKSPDSPPKNKK